VRRRAKRDLIVVAGIVAILATIVILNYYLQTGDLYRQYDNMRRQLEEQRAGQGLDLVDWDVIRSTRGRLMTGGQFTDELLAMDGKHVDIIGFMTPLNEFRNISQFILLPVPIECYFCNMPPARDIILVEMAEGQEVDFIHADPVLVNGHFNVFEGRAKFFYAITDASLGPGDPSKPPERKYIREEHMQPDHTVEPPELDAPMEPPTAR